mmetsp:Transcript_35438/g.104817  ORF Transcript_35438/g.104817 Transcript_35438/m.104817 type:complete len:114 (-) Transcript_35438:130-471(-)
MHEMGRRMTQGKRGTARPGVCTKTASDVVVSLYVGALRHMRCCLCAHGSMAAHSLVPVRAWQRVNAYVAACAHEATKPFTSTAPPSFDDISATALCTGTHMAYLRSDDQAALR